MMAQLTAPKSDGSAEIAQFSRRLAPSDPMPAWLVATKLKESFTPQDTAVSLEMFEETVRLAPNDFRWWIELGRANEQAEKFDKAEEAFRRAIDLAPTYTFPHWQFGNFLLRRGRSEEAFVQLIKTTEQSRVYRDQVFSLAWDYFDKDPAKVEQLAADTPDVKVSLALFYCDRGAAKDSLRVWNELSDAEKRRNEVTSRIIAQRLYDKHFVREAVEFARQSGFDPEAQFETISNPGFEKVLGTPDESLFGWSIYRSDPKLDLITDSSVKVEGAKSLKGTFKAYAKNELYNIAQLVGVRSSTPYRITFKVRTEDLRSGGPPLIQVTDCTSATILGASQPFSTGTNDWKEYTIDFTSPADCEGVVIRLSRNSCGDLCPINGTFWIDDFKLQTR